MNELIEKFIETDSSIQDWDKNELDKLNKFLKKEIIGKHNEFQFGTTNEKTNDWEYHKSGLNFFLGSSLNIELKFNKEFQLFVLETFMPEPRLISGLKLEKGDEIVQVELDGRYQYGPDCFFELLSNLKPKTKIKLFFTRNRLNSYEDSDKAPIYETQSFDERIEMIKTKFKAKFKDDKIVISKLKEWKRNLFNIFNKIF